MPSRNLLAGTVCVPSWRDSVKALNNEVASSLLRANMPRW